VLSERIAATIGRNAKSVLNVDDDKEQIIVYGAISLLQTVFAVFWVVVAGLFFGILYEALVFSIVVSILRKYSGGVHASSPSRCILIGTALAVIVGITIDHQLYRLNLPIIILISIVCIIVSFIIILKNAPVDSIKKPITDIEIKKMFKIKSIIVILCFLVLVLILFVLNRMNQKQYYIKFIESIDLALLWQSITLTKLGACILNKVDFVLKYINLRR
jgi:Membrane protein putatively involved in post-translational modification of the autoinducing quorum-sensing peptide